MIDVRDVGAVAAAALTSAALDGETLALTGPRAVTYPQLAGLIAAASGQPVTVTDIDPTTVRDVLVGRGTEPWEADHFHEMYDLFRDGASAAVTDVVQRVTGNPPRDVDIYIAEATAADAFTREDA